MTFAVCLIRGCKKRAVNHVPYSPPFLFGTESDKPLSLPRGILDVKRKLCCILHIFTSMLS